MDDEEHGNVLTVRLDLPAERENLLEDVQCPKGDLGLRVIQPLDQVEGEVAQFETPEIVRFQVGDERVR